jgi:hypothetical protein
MRAMTHLRICSERTLLCHCDHVMRIFGFLTLAFRIAFRGFCFLFIIHLIP